MAHDHSEIGHTHYHEQSNFLTYLPAILSFALLISGIIFEQTEASFFKYPINLIWFLVAYAFVGLKVNFEALKEIRHGNVFSEFFLMSIATIGAFLIGEYSEGVAVMLFYSIGELFQDAAVERAQKSIKALLDIRPDKVTVIRNGEPFVVKPSEVKIDEIIQVKPGEKVALDGELISQSASFNTSALLVWVSFLRIPPTKVAKVGKFETFASFLDSGYNSASTITKVVDSFSVASFLNFGFIILQFPHHEAEYCTTTFSLLETMSFKVSSVNSISIIF